MMISRKLLFILLCSWVLVAQTEVRYPELTFKYDWRSRIIDAVGGLVFRNNVNPEQRNQLAKQLPDFIVAWERDAPILFGEVFNFFKCGFKNTKRTAIIYLSNNSSYGSNRFLILGLRYYLDRESWLLPVSREDGFTALVFHELLHI